MEQLLKERQHKHLFSIFVNNFNLKPAAIVRELILKRPFYIKTASYEHFGRNDVEFTWEIPSILV
jgi:S-adenosylmethionine synthetase